MFKNVFGSGFLVRTAHVVLTWVVTLILFLHDTELRKQEETGQLVQPVLFVLLVLVSVLLYFTVSLMDPGFILSDDPDLQSGGVGGAAGHDRPRVQIPASAPLWSLSAADVCLCSEQQPMRSKHCQTCHHCVRRYDHHCPWIENCVGEQNHRWFVVYLAVQLLVLVWALHITWTGLVLVPGLSPWLRSNGVLLVVLVLLVLLALVVLLLLGSHLYLVSLNTTTWEFMSRHRISYLKHCGAEQNPFDRGTLLNLWGFFCVWGSVVWEQVYFREGSDPV
ncbi:palmitoyltransferase ZDHHC12-B isoform X3 [Austrofundulus limnaeus]|uniref:Palmitoyltransferase n=1 Tax=Austrofundulus limnaeus TaxID=52670 RepID=A0A2I4AIQ2_AUSLI|nr:PREDICTED: probable palmitoyltransferase ZDHHC12 isoform X3 [Austrofundulus limnaeus]